MIQITDTLLARRATRLSLALVDDAHRGEDSTPTLRFVSGLTSPWIATVAGRPSRKRGRWFAGRGSSPHAALTELVDALTAECAVAHLDARQILRDAHLVPLA